MSTDILVWTIEHGGLVATVSERGQLDGDAALVEMLRTRLNEPVTVYRHGTVRSRADAPHREIVLHPGDGRHVVACVRRLCDGGDFAVIDCNWA